MATEKNPERAAAGRKGGEATKARYGTEHFRAAGRKGGRKGGATTMERYGRGFFARIGRKGGASRRRARAT